LGWVVLCWVGCLGGIVGNAELAVDYGEQYHVIR
jgi:hypothetical protein